jgi:archaellum biogenesis ATPase FlaH
MDDKTGKKSKGSIPDLLTKALSVTFDNHVGHDYMMDSDSRYEFYHHTEKKIPFDLDFFNKITRGGFSLKTLNIFLAGTGVGKTLVMCHLAGAALSRGFNVLYITMEMAEERIAERIDANLLNVDINTLEKIDKKDYEQRFAALKHKTCGKLIIKEYPTAAASTLHFTALLNELQLKKSFRPDLIFIDYLNICASSRIRPGGNVNSYTYIKAIAEELRGLAVEHKVPVISATQTTRQGFDSSDLELTDTSESFGLPATADFMAAIITNEELEALNQFMVKTLKNRYADKNVNKRFVVGVDRSKMRLYDVAASAQTNICDAGQAKDDDGDEKIRKPFEHKKRDFKGFKI